MDAIVYVIGQIFNSHRAGTNSFVWDARNQLSSMNSNFVSFQHDPFGRRTGKTVAGITTNYLYDGANIAQEISGGSPIANLLSGG